MGAVSITYSSLDVRIEVKFDKPFRVRAGGRYPDGRNKEALVETAIINVNNDGNMSYSWGKGKHVNQDGRVGQRAATQILLHESEIPADALLEIRKEYVRLVREAGKNLTIT